MSYKVVEVNSVTTLLLMLLLAVLISASLTIGWMWNKNQTLRTENAELLKESNRLLALTEKLSHTSNDMIDRVASLGLDSMTMVNHVCGPKNVRDFTQTASRFTPFSTEKKFDPLTGMPVEMKVMEYLDDTQPGNSVAHKNP